MKRSTKYVGLDVHQATTVASVRAKSGCILARAVVPTEEAALLEFFGGMRGSVHVALEKGTQAQWLHDLLKPRVHRVLVCDRRGEKKHGNRYNWSGSYARNVFAMAVAWVCEAAETPLIYSLLQAIARLLKHSKFSALISSERHCVSRIATFARSSQRWSVAAPGAGAAPRPRSGSAGGRPADPQLLLRRAPTFDSCRATRQGGVA